MTSLEGGRPLSATARNDSHFESIIFFVFLESFFFFVGMMRCVSSPFSSPPSMFSPTASWRGRRRRGLVFYWSFFRVIKSRIYCGARLAEYEPLPIDRDRLVRVVADMRRLRLFPADFYHIIIPLFSRSSTISPASGHSHKVSSWNESRSLRLRRYGSI